MNRINPPAQFLVDSLPALPKGRVLDAAAGSGRNALFFAEHGFVVHAIDRNPEALLMLQSAVRERRLLHMTTEVVDLETERAGEALLPSEVYDVVVVFFYLYRPLFPALLQTLKPGGMLLYETFLVENYLHYQRPKQREFCLETHELLTLTQGLQVLHYDEGVRRGKDGQAGRFTARLLAQKGQPEQ